IDGHAWRVTTTTTTPTGTVTTVQDIGENFGASIASLFGNTSVIGADGKVVIGTDGKVVVRSTDFNNDGKPDFAVGAPFASPGNRLSTGAVYVHSGPAPGKLLLRYDGTKEDDRFGAAVAAAGDLNADGFHDLLVGAPNALSD